MSYGIAELAGAIRRGERSSRDVIEETFRDVKARDPFFNTVTRSLYDRALAAADVTDRKIARGEEIGALAGVPFGIKDLFDVRGEVTTAGSLVLRNNPPAQEDAAVVRNLCAAGAIPVVMTNMDEFAYGFATDNAHHGVTRNPRNPEHLAGGSSGGSAAAVAAGMLPLALGSDTNGSIRVPASLCGIWGLRPTQGVLPMSGVYPFVASLDVVGPFTRSPEDLRLAFSGMAAVTHGELPSLEGLRVARLGGWFKQDLDAVLDSTIDDLVKYFGTSNEVVLPEADKARAAAFVISAAEGGNLHLPRLKTCADEYDPATRDRLIAGAILPAAQVIQAHRLRTMFREQMHALMQQYDILIAPATLGEAPRIDMPFVTLNGKSVSARANLGLFTQPLSLAGFPVLSAPLRKPGAEGLPLGVQLIARPGEEELLFAVAEDLQTAGLLGYEPAAADGGN